jgi:hypothetical protein
MSKMLTDYSQPAYRAARDEAMRHVRYRDRKGNRSIETQRYTLPPSRRAIHLAARVIAHLRKPERG